MVVAGSRNPLNRLYLAIGITLSIILISYLTFGQPKKHIATIKNAAIGVTVDKICHSEQDDIYNFKTRYPLREKPEKKVVALLFAGRKQYVSILECYIRRNLVRNGGWLDEVVWIIHTQDQTDINFLEEIINEVPEYTQHIARSYHDAYSILERDTIYVKIDDDVVFMEDHTIPAIVKRLDDNPQYSIVSANVMNQPALSWVHYHLGAIHPYLPELEKPDDFVENRAEEHDWRLSSTPAWHGPENYTFNRTAGPPFEGHRWLRLPDTHLVEETPAGAMGGDGREYNEASIGWSSWAIAAQQHYSFLENVERKQLWRYKFDLWYYHFDRLSINFIAFDGSTLLDNPVPEGADDEIYLTKVMPKNISRPAVLDGSGMAVHFSFSIHIGDLKTTDLLARYRNYADEFICGKEMGSPRA
ncbi:hypothetical protein PMZ80_007806 [Knufia obscura]|uniref:Uncharacterized protein n=1 Tax=Knufia obscura TaxID=1635080 RepID=A0ABR0RIE5_9EURO|nr:hypothetical protein PMZ80_007806 [Knufia obscura]